MESVRVGFDGKYKVGCWTPVWVTIAAGEEDYAGQIELTASDADGIPVRFADSGPAVKVPPKGETTVVRYVKFGRPRGSLKVELHSESEALAQRSFLAGDLPAAQPSSTELVLSLGAGLGVEEALRLGRGRGDELIATPLITAAADLPDRWWGYEGVDTIFWAGSNLPFVEGLSDEQLAALETWVQMGGRLILSVGGQGEKLLGPTGRLARLNPGRFVEVVEQRRSGELERYTGASQPLLQRNSPSMPQTVLADVPFREESAEGSGGARYATVIRFPRGLGQVVLVTLDLDQPPLAGWEGRPRLLARLLERSLDARDDDASDRQLGQVTHVGFDDLGGQLAGSLEQFSGVPLFSFTWVAALLVLYILLIGPADYFILRRFVGRMELTWITLPLVVLAFCVAAVVFASLWKGTERRLNQVDLVDIDLESGLARGTSWSHLYTPRTEELDLAWQPQPPFKAAPPEALLAWHGLAGKGLGGMEGKQPVVGLFDRPYTLRSGAEEAIAAPAELAALPVQVSATKSLLARWWTTADLAESGQLSVNFDGRLQGEIINPLDVDLLDGVIFFETSAYKLRSKLAPGERLVLTSQSPVVHVERRLTQRRIVSSGETKAPWNPHSFDVPRVLEIMMFYDAAGGKTYTGLTNRQQPLVDLSRHLKTGRAVLLARAETPAGRLTQNGEPLAVGETNQHTFYRLVYPVAKRGGEEAKR